jgi:hypothetical protein
MLSNHSVAAIVEGEVRKVVCRTCGNSHDFKHAKEPEKKKKAAKQSAYEQVLASVLAGRNLGSASAPSPAKPARPKRSLSRASLGATSAARRRPSQPR